MTERDLLISNCEFSFLHVAITSFFFGRLTELGQWEPALRIIIERSNPLIVHLST